MGNNCRAVQYSGVQISETPTNYDQQLINKEQWSDVLVDRFFGVNFTLNDTRKLIVDKNGLVVYPLNQSLKNMII
jgi:hypothetical protein